MRLVPRSPRLLLRALLRQSVVGRAFRRQIDAEAAPSGSSVHVDHGRPTAGWAATFAGVVVAVSALAASPAAAHTGLGTRSGVEGFLHPLGGVDHLLAMVAVGVLAALSKNRLVGWLTPLAFVAGMVAGAGLGLVGVSLPAVEIVIAASVIALGVLLGGIAGEFGLWLPPVVALFGAAHGYAHGAELPLGAVPLLYVVGFVGATAVLHLLGAGLGLRIRRTEWVRTATSAAVSAAGAAMLITL